EATGTMPIWVYNISPYQDTSGQPNNPPGKAARFVSSNAGLPVGTTWGSKVPFWELNNEPWSSALVGWAWSDGGDYANRAKTYRDAMAPNTAGKFVIAAGGDSWNSQIIGTVARCWWDGVVMHPYYQNSPPTFGAFQSDVIGWLKRQFDPS